MNTDVRQRRIDGRTINVYSQLGQDVWVMKTLFGKRAGFFIELGAYDGVYHSNTLALERDFDWNGLLIEANMPAVKKACETRKAEVYWGVISDEERWEAFYVAEQFSGLERFTRPNLLVGHEQFNNRTAPRLTQRLERVLNYIQVPQIVDYLSLDVEGAEYPILKAYLESKNACKFRCMTPNRSSLGCECR